MRSVPGKKWNQTPSSQRSAAQSKRNAIPHKRVNECSSVANHEYSVPLRLRYAKHQGRSAHGIAQRLPLPAALLQCRMATENFPQRARDLGAYHRAGVDPRRFRSSVQDVYWLNSTITAIKEVEIH